MPVSLGYGRTNLSPAPDYYAKVRLCTAINQSYLGSSVLNRGPWTLVQKNPYEYLFQNMHLLN